MAQAWSQSELVTFRQTAVVVPGVSPDVFPWDKYPVPRFLYKYFPPERLHVLTECLIRFSQRQVFEDHFELRPEVADFGSDDEIRMFMAIDPVLRRHPIPLREAVIRYVFDTPGREALLREQTQKWLSFPDEFLVLSLSEDAACDRMWEQYAANDRGFVIAFDTTHPRFQLLCSPGRLGKVEYSDEPISSFLSAYGPNALFRKRTRYQFEAEWRSIRHVGRFRAAQVLKPEEGLLIYRSFFDPACIAEILVRKTCTIEYELRSLRAIDGRYGHVAVRLVGD